MSGEYYLLFLLVPMEILDIIKVNLKDFTDRRKRNNVKYNPKN
jgi:hypothetical protein